MLDKTEGIILRTTKYSETSLIAKIFTKKYGLLSFLIQGVRSSKSKQKGNIIQPLQMLHLEVYMKEQRNLNRAKEYSAAYIYKNLHSDFAKQSVALFCIELIAKCIREQEVNERLYDYLSLFLIELDGQEHGIENKPVFFLLETASILGFELSLQNILSGTYFNLESGRFENSLSSTHNFLNAHETEILKKMLAVYYEKNELKLNHAERKLLLDKLLLYFRWHIADFTDLRSPAILHEVLR
jgi:DNA repair protein RecO (recombination protein O)